MIKHGFSLMTGEGHSITFVLNIIEYAGNEEMFPGVKADIF